MFDLDEGGDEGGVGEGGKAGVAHAVVDGVLVQQVAQMVLVSTCTTTFRSITLYSKRTFDI